MQLALLGLLIAQCNMLARRLEALDGKCPRSDVKPLFAISGLQVDLQRVIAIEMILMRLEVVTSVVPADVFDVVSDVLETIWVTYAYHFNKRLTIARSRARVQRIGQSSPR